MRRQNTVIVGVRTASPPLVCAGRAVMNGCRSCGRCRGRAWTNLPVPAEHIVRRRGSEPSVRPRRRRGRTRWLRHQNRHLVRPWTVIEPGSPAGSVTPGRMRRPCYYHPVTVNVAIGTRALRRQTDTHSVWLFWSLYNRTVHRGTGDGGVRSSTPAPFQTVNC